MCFFRRHPILCVLLAECWVRTRAGSSWPSEVLVLTTETFPAWKYFPSRDEHCVLQHLPFLPSHPAGCICCFYVVIIYISVCWPSAASNYHQFWGWKHVRIHLKVLQIKCPGTARLDWLCLEPRKGLHSTPEVWMCFLCLWGCWLNPVPCGCFVEAPDFLLAVSGPPPPSEASLRF